MTVGVQHSNTSALIGQADWVSIGAHQVTGLGNASLLGSNATGAISAIPIYTGGTPMAYVGDSTVPGGWGYAGGAGPAAFAITPTTRYSQDITQFLANLIPGQIVVFTKDSDNTSFYAVQLTTALTLSSGQYAGQGVLVGSSGDFTSGNTTMYIIGRAFLDASGNAKTDLQGFIVGLSSGNLGNVTLTGTNCTITNPQGIGGNPVVVIPVDTADLLTRVIALEAAVLALQVLLTSPTVTSGTINVASGTGTYTFSANGTLVTVA